MKESPLAHLQDELRLVAKFGEGMDYIKGNGLSKEAGPTP